MQDEADPYAPLLDTWRQLAAVYQSRAHTAVEADRQRAQDQADRFVQLHTSMETLIAAGRFSLEGPRRQYEIPRPEAGVHKECPECGLLKHERHFGRKATQADGLKAICRECERLKRLALKNEGTPVA